MSKTNRNCRTSKSFVKKKAALTLLRLYRKHPDIIEPQWAERIISIMDDLDMGVAVSVTSLVMALAQDNMEQYRGAYAKAAARLKRILIDGDYAGDYLYYKVPCPWIQVKLLRLLQYFPPSGSYQPLPPPPKKLNVEIRISPDTHYRRQPCARNDPELPSKNPGSGPRTK